MKAETKAISPKFKYSLNHGVVKKLFYLAYILVGIWEKSIADLGFGIAELKSGLDLILIQPIRNPKSSDSITPCN
jgi:hypothetical protein